MLEGGYSHRVLAEGVAASVLALLSRPFSFFSFCTHREEYMQTLRKRHTQKNKETTEENKEKSENEKNEKDTATTIEDTLSDDSTNEEDDDAIDEKINTLLQAQDKDSANDESSDFFIRISPAAKKRVEEQIASLIDKIKKIQKPFWHCFD